MNRLQQEQPSASVRPAPVQEPVASVGEAETLKRVVDQVRGKHAQQAQYAAAAQEMSDQGKVSKDVAGATGFIQAQRQTGGE